MERLAGWFERSWTPSIPRRFLHEHFQQFRGSILVNRANRIVVQGIPDAVLAERQLGTRRRRQCYGAGAPCTLALYSRRPIPLGGRITGPPQWVGAYPREIGGSNGPLSGSQDRTESPREPISCEHVLHRCGPLLEKGWARPMLYRESALRRSTDGDDREGTGGAETPGLSA